MPWPAASGPIRLGSRVITSIIPGASWPSSGNSCDRSPLPITGASMFTAAGLTMRTAPASSVSNRPTGHW